MNFNINKDSVIVIDGNDWPGAARVAGKVSGDFKLVFGSGKEAETASGSSGRHLGVIGEALARIRLSLKPRPFAELLRQERLDTAFRTADNTTFCLISSGQSDALLAEAEALSAQCGGLLWICPLDPEIERREIPASIRFVPVQL